MRVGWTSGGEDSEMKAGEVTAMVKVIMDMEGCDVNYAAEGNMACNVCGRGLVWTWD